MGTPTQRQARNTLLAHMIVIFLAILVLTYCACGKILRLRMDFQSIEAMIKLTCDSRRSYGATHLQWYEI